jgi:hypothetical protein
MSVRSFNFPSHIDQRLCVLDHAITDPNKEHDKYDAWGLAKLLDFSIKNFNSGQMQDITIIFPSLV